MPDLSPLLWLGALPYSNRLQNKCFVVFVFLNLSTGPRRRKVGPYSKHSLCPQENHHLHGNVGVQREESRADKACLSQSTVSTYVLSRGSKASPR